MKEPRYYVERLCHNLECIITACIGDTVDMSVFVRAVAGSYVCISMLRELLPKDEEDEER